MSILNNKSRNGNFTSSAISALLSLDRSGKNFGKPALTYITEKNFERLLGASLDTEIDAKPLQWGKLNESRVFELLGMSYELTSDITSIHPDFKYWVGSADGINHKGDKAIIDIKCPLTKKSFVQLVLPFYDGQENVMDCIVNGWEYKGLKIDAHKSGDDYYWQLVSNACIQGVDYAELIVYMPYQDELLDIVNAAKAENYRWVEYTDLPFLKKGGIFKNITTIRFKVPQSDKDKLRGAVEAGGKMLIEPTIFDIKMLD